MLDKKISKLDNFGKLLFFFRILFYPIVSLIELPKAWISSLYNSRILLNGQWDKYMGFLPRASINNLFYRTQWFNINKFGREGVSNLIGLGDYPLSNFFQLSLFSSYIFSNAGAVTLISGASIWFFSFLIWMEVSNWFWVLLILFFLFLSSTTYSMTFALQNYQILSWMWIPSALYHMNQGEYISTFFFWILAALFGVTQILWGIPISIYFSFHNHSLIPFLAISLASLICLLRFLPILKRKDGIKRIYDLIKIINIKLPKSIYKRDIKATKLIDSYFTFIYLIPIIVLWINDREMPILLFIGLIIFIINQRIMRVADLESNIMLMATLFSHHLLESNPNTISFLCFLVALNPSGLLTGIEQVGGKIDSFSPFDTTKLYKKVNSFFKNIEKDAKVIAAFNDPKGYQENIFDGYSVIHELAVAIASENDFHIIPDWHAVTESNYEGAINLWGRDINQVLENCETFSASYIFIYQESGTKINQKWDKNFSLISEFDWSDYTAEINQKRIWPEESYTPKWFLLKLKK